MQEFYERCIDKLDNQVYQLEDREKYLCAFHAIRYTLQDIYKTEGIEKLMRIINHSPSVSDKLLP